MSKILMLVCLVVSVAACSNGGGGGGAAQEDLSRFRESPELQKFKNAGGHTPTLAELTAHGWCEVTDDSDEEYQNMLFRANGTVKWIFGKIISKVPEVYESTYVIDSGKIIATVAGEPMIAQIVTAKVQGAPQLLLQTDDGGQAVFGACTIL